MKILDNVPFSDLEARADHCAAKLDLISAQFFYKDALENAKRQSASKEDMTRLKNKLVNVTKRAVTSEGYYNEISVEKKFTKKEIRYIKVVREEVLSLNDINEIVRRLALSEHFHVNYSNVVSSATKTQPIHVILASHAVVSGEGHILKGGEDGISSWIMKMYQISYGLIMQMHLGRLFHLLIENGKISKEILIEYFRKRDILPVDVLNILNVGIERFFAKDYVSFLHIFVTQFEGAFMGISESLGINVVSLERTKEVATVARTLSAEALVSKEFTDVWGEDFCREINYLMYEPLGYRLRHRIAHGEITYVECGYVNSIRVLMLYFVLMNKVKRVN